MHRKLIVEEFLGECVCPAPAVPWHWFLLIWLLVLSAWYYFQTVIPRGSKGGEAPFKKTS